MRSDQPKRGRALSGLMGMLVLVASLGVLVGCEKMILGPDPGNTPKENFEVLWRTLDENYALFGVRGINWDSLHAVYGARVTSSTSETELWNVATGLLSQLDDGHVVLVNGDNSRGFNASSLVGRARDDFSLSVISGRYLSGAASAGAGVFTYGKIRGTNIGYVHVATYTASGGGNGTDWAYDIDKIVSELSACDGMIMDVRNNGGGLRVTGNTINAVFLDREITYFLSKRKTGPGHSDFGEPVPVFLAPRPGAPRFTKSIIVLTNRFSASGAEYTAQLFKNLPYAKLIGDTTFGALGEITNVAQMPNGWIFWYPCTLTVAPDGTSPEGKGIVPDILVENSAADIAAGRDRVLERAVSELSP